MTAAVRYEDFDRAPIQPSAEPAEAVDPHENLTRLLARARGRARAEGYEQGVAESEARAARDIEAQLDTVATLLGEAAADRQAVRRQTVAAARTLLSRFFRAAAPRIAALNLAEALAEALTRALSAERAEIPVLEAPDDGLGRAAAALALRMSGGQVASGPATDGARARLSWRGGADEFDADAALSEAIRIIDDALAAVGFDAAESPEEGDRT